MFTIVISLGKPLKFLLKTLLCLSAPLCVVVVTMVLFLSIPVPSHPNHRIRLLILLLGIFSHLVRQMYQIRLTQLLGIFSHLQLVNLLILILSDSFSPIRYFLLGVFPMDILILDSLSHSRDLLSQTVKFFLLGIFPISRRCTY